jgi:hypothetical protein|tara:strand:- start:161 stop:607 length:447 start_codon:yes stop_codon:yes gene_type:complete
MIQAYRLGGASPITAGYIDIYDITKSTVTYKPLWVLTSQLTGKEKAFVPVVLQTSYPRVAGFLWTMVKSQAEENLTAQAIFIGDTDYPYGFYDLEVYQNTSDTNLDKTGLTKLFTGLFNVRGKTGAESVTYSEYTTNDADTESVYVTI